MGRPRGFPSNAAAVRVIVFGADPVAEYTATSIDLANGRAMAGTMGAIRAGEPSDPSRRFSGELGPRQAFRGSLIGASRSAAPGFNTALPNTHGPIAGGTVSDMLARVAPQ